jgi:hypothetical protein
MLYGRPLKQGDFYFKSSVSKKYTKRKVQILLGTGLRNQLKFSKRHQKVLILLTGHHLWTSSPKISTKSNIMCKTTGTTLLNISGKLNL